MAVEQIVEVDVGQISVDKSFNSRSKYERVEDLAERIRSEGQTVPVIVTNSGDARKPYKLIAGYRRFLAVSTLKGTKLKCLVRDIKNEKEAFLVNLSENIARDDLTPYEVATSLVRLRDTYKMSAKEIQAFLNVSKGFSKSNINHLTSAVERLHSKILKAWADEHPACTMHNVIKWKSLEHPEQLEAFADAAAVKADSGDGDGDGDGNGGNGKEKPTPAARISRAMVEEALTACRNSDAKGAEFAVEALRFVLGKVAKLKVGEVVIFDPKAMAKAEEEAKAAEKAAKVEAKAKADAEIERIKKEAAAKIEAAKKAATA